MNNNISSISSKQTLTRTFNNLNKFSRRALKEEHIRPVKNEDETYTITFPVGTQEINLKEQEEMVGFDDYFVYVLPSGKKFHYMDSLTLTYLAEK